MFTGSIPPGFWGSPTRALLCVGIRCWQVMFSHSNLRERITSAHKAATAVWVIALTFWPPRFLSRFLFLYPFFLLILFLCICSFRHFTLFAWSVIWSCRSTYLSVYLCVCLYLFISLYLPTYVFIYSFVSLSTYLSLHIYLYKYVSFSLSLFSSRPRSLPFAPPLKHFEEWLIITAERRERVMILI